MPLDARRALQQKMALRTSGLARDCCAFVARLFDSDGSKVDEDCAITNSHAYNMP